MTLKVIDPWSGQLVCELARHTAADIDRLLAAARAAHVAWRAVPLVERVRRVERALHYFEAHTEAIARDVTRQMGKPVTQARNEVKGLLERARHMAAIAATSLGPDVLPAKAGFVRRIEHVPHGVVLDIAAWNYPLLIAVNVVVPALLAGNAVLLKHSARTPLCGVHFERAFGNELGVPALVQNVIMSHADVAALVADPRVDHVAFTGSVAGGREVLGHASHRFVDVGLELGGKDPAYVAADADLDWAVPNVVDGACYNAGQSCCAVERVYVHARVHAAFLERAVRGLRDYVIGDPMLETTTMGPLASKSALDVLDAQVQDAVRRGARCLLGGQRLHGSCYAPTLLTDCPNDALVMQEESFGPLLPVLAVTGDDEAIAHMNDSRYGLTASVWTASRERAERFGREVEAGTVFQNRCDYLDPALPWTGVKDSGKGVTLSHYGFAQLTRRKSIHFRDQGS